jgi:hypothetical protein
MKFLSNFVTGIILIVGANEGLILKNLKYTISASFNSSYSESYIFYAVGNE